MSPAVSETKVERGVFNGSLRGFIDFFASYSRTGFFVSSILSVQHGFETPFGSRAGLSDNQGSFKLARVALPFYSGLCNKNISSTNPILGVDRVGNRRIDANLASKPYNDW